jgi:hypothetical protein
MRGATEALRLTEGSVLMMPKLLGPMTRMPLARASRTTSCCSSAPSGPASAKPLETTTAPLTPRSTHWASTSGTEAAGTVRTARSTGPGTSDTAAYASVPPTSNASRLTTWTGPAKRPSVIAWSTRAPKLEASRLAPTTTTDRALSSACMLSDSARCSRAAMTAIERSVGSMSKETSMIPSSRWCSTS